jgi:hypothetical protein
MNVRIKMSVRNIDSNKENIFLPFCIQLVAVDILLQDLRQLSQCSDELRFNYVRSKSFCVLHCVQTGSGSHPATYLMSTGDFPFEKSGKSVKLTTHLHLESRSRIALIFKFNFNLNVIA